MRFENQTFTGMTVTLDFNEFVDCTIKDCLILCHGGTFRLERTTITSCKFGVGAPASSTLSFLKLVRASGGLETLDALLNQGPAVSTDQVTFN